LADDLPGAHVELSPLNPPEGDFLGIDFNNYIHPHKSPSGGFRGLEKTIKIKDRIL
jgi:hypothetical protein